MKPKLILRDYLALDRTLLAAQRTLLAYLRTFAGLLGSGIGLVKLFDEPILRTIGWLLIFTAPIALIIGITECLRIRKKYKRFFPNEDIPDDVCD